MSFLLGKLQEYVLHFCVSALIILGLVGILKYHNDIRNLNERLYLAGKSHNNLVVSSPPKKNIIDKVLDRKKLTPAPEVPSDQISSVAEIQQSTCAPVVITILKDGTIVTPSTGVVSIIVESYEHPLYQNKLDLRIAGLTYPRMQQHPSDWDFALQVSYFHVWKLAPDLTLSGDFVGAGLSYGPNIKHFENFVVGIGYGYRWDENYWTPYAAASLRLGSSIK
jgi:hypothetical protein